MGPARYPVDQAHSWSRARPYRFCRQARHLTHRFGQSRFCRHWLSRLGGLCSGEDRFSSRQLGPLVTEVLAFLFLGLMLACAPPTRAAGEKEGIVRSIPRGIPTNNFYVKLGYLDATLYGADPTGTKDSTKALREAVVNARDHQLVLFLRPGTYQVSDTIQGIMEFGRGKAKRDFPTQILGSLKSGGVTIKLAANAPGFNNPRQPKPVLDFFAAKLNAKRRVAVEEFSSNNYNHTLRNVRILIGAGNSGAVGVRMGTAQGALLEDVVIESENGAPFFAGVNDVPGQGGGTFNLEVIGGQYGAYLTEKSRFPLMAGCRFKGQTVAGVRHEHVHPLVVAGCYFEEPKGVNGIELHQLQNPRNKKTAKACGVTVVDSVFQLAKNSVSVFNPDNRNIYLNNVYLDSGVVAVQNGAKQWSLAEKTLIKEYAFTPTLRDPRAPDQYSSHLIDGKLSAGEIKDFVPYAQSFPGYNQLRAFHTWSTPLPSFEDDGVIIATEHGVIGDTLTDNTAKLQALIDANPNGKIFLPKGIYFISKIVLHANSKLFGVSRYYTVLHAIEDKSPKAPAQLELVTTDDAADGTGSLSFLHLITNNESRTRNHHLVWRLGKNSMVHAVHADDWGRGRPKSDTKAFWVKGSGGGRWYSVGTQLRELSGDPNCRALLVEGTTQPLSIYGYYTERWDSLIAEVLNAQNVRFFYFKSEAHPGFPPLEINHSKNVAVFAVYGNIDLSGRGKGIVTVRDSEDVLVAQVRSQDKTSVGASWFSVREDQGSKTHVIPSGDFANLFKRGNFNMGKFR